jgi:CheY-like chemotaxis protein
METRHRACYCKAVQTPDAHPSLARKYTDSVLSPVPRPTVPFRPLRLLFVDDDENLRTFMALVLDSLGHSTEVACDGIEGLARFSESRFDVVITDLRMPRLDGWGFAAAVKAISANQPIVMLTGFAEPLQLDNKATPVDLVLEKPASAAALAHALETVTCRSCAAPV